MRKLRRHLLDSGARYFHCVSRVAGREFLFGDEEREAFRRIMRKVEAFSGVRVLTWTILSNHFHLLVEVGEPPGDMSDEELLARLGKLYSRQHVREVRDTLKQWDKPSMRAPREALRGRYIRRMNNLSEFMRSLKQRFTSAYNRMHGRRGTLWEERFRATAAGGDLDAVLTVAAYIDLNAVRAGMCDDPKDYRWCGYAEAVAGDQAARAGLAKVLEDYSESGHWRRVGNVYRKVLFGSGEESAERRGFSAEKVAEVLEGGGQLPRAELLRCRVRYFTDGLAVGTREFVESFFEASRAAFGERRKNGARKMRGGDGWGALFAARDLQVDPVTPPG